MMGFGDGSGISWTTCKQSAPRSRQIITPTPTPHRSIFTGRMLFLTPNQHCQSTEGKYPLTCLLIYIYVLLTQNFLIRAVLQPPVRQESCQGLYRLCRGRTSDGQTGYIYLLPILINLLPSLDEATAIKAPQKKVRLSCELVTLFDSWFS